MPFTNHYPRRGKKKRKEGKKRRGKRNRERGRKVRGECREGENAKCEDSYGPEASEQKLPSFSFYL